VFDFDGANFATFFAASPTSSSLTGTIAFFRRPI